MLANNDHIRRFEHLYMPYDSSRVTTDLLMQTITLRNADESRKQLLMVAGFSFVMMLIAGAANGIRISSAFLLYALVSGALVLLMIRYWKTRSIVIDLLNRNIRFRNRRLFFNLTRTIAFRDIEDVILNKQFMYGIFTYYSLTLKTAEGKMNHTLFILGRNEAAAQQLKGWCREVFCFAH